MTAVLEMPVSPSSAAAPQATDRMAMVRSILLMFLPFIAFQIGEVLLANWEPARRLEHLLAPYAFSTSLFIGLVVGLLQISWNYAKTRELSSYVLQQLGWLLAFTFVPLYFGHFVHQGAGDPVGFNVIGLVGMALASVYAVDFATGGNLMMAFPRHFSPETAKMSHLPRFRRVMGHIELAMVAMFALKGSYLVFGTRLLPHGTYILLLPFVAKGLLFSFMTFAITYPQWAKRQAQKEKAAALVAG
ncbi:MAG: hypothetical protein JWM80_619 [Cyanobacteria bacterium RYN_339]|nr:hypothetical protein [Cyanobacteria bacterium RYN_339]